MEAKKAQPVSTTKVNEAPVTTTKIIDFFGDVKAELKKINWTSPEELKVYTKIVVGMTFILGMSIYLVDLTIQSFLLGLGYLFRLFI